MAHILVNGISAKSGGGRSVLTNFLRVLVSRPSSHRYTVLIPGNDGYLEFARPTVQLLPMPVASRAPLLPLVNEWLLPRLVRRLECDAVLNFADLPVPTPVPQVFLFDWPYAAYPDSGAWHLGGRMDVLKRRLKLLLFRRHLPDINVFLAQGVAIGARMKKLYGLEHVAVVPNAVSIDNCDAREGRDFGLSGSFRFLCLTRYYSHKNLEMLLEIAERIRLEGLDWRIVITIDADQGEGARKLLEAIERRGLQGVLVNVGAVPMDLVPSLYRQTDALLLPTLLESFSGTYVEALFHEKPIFTSDYDFARDVCGDAAFYFDPLDASSIWEVVSAGVRDDAALQQKRSDGRARLAAMPGWERTFESYIAHVEEAIKGGA